MPTLFYFDFDRAIGIRIELDSGGSAAATSGMLILNAFKHYHLDYISITSEYDFDR